MLSLERNLVQDDGLVCEGQIMVVPPLECAWLAGEDCRLQSGEEGYILFEAKGKYVNVTKDCIRFDEKVARIRCMPDEDTV